jgi:hypothetical protein
MTGKSFYARISYSVLVTACVGLPLGASHPVAAKNKGVLPEYRVSSTVPTNGDQNPYGVAFVPPGFPKGGIISPGDLLVSNFNNAANCQGQGTTIIQYTPSESNDAVAPPGSATVFFPSPQLGLSTALGVLKGGFVIVGNVPSNVPSVGCGTLASPGVLQVIDLNGKLLTTLTDSSPGGNIFGSPWDLTIANDNGNSAQVFVSNVLTGTVGRLDLAITSTSVSIAHSFIVAAGYAFRTDPTAFLVGPTGLALDKSGNLFVASTGDNQIFKVPNASKPMPPAATMGTVVFSDPHLRGPLALVFSSTGTLLTANGDAVDTDPTHPSEIVEFTTSGAFVNELNIEATIGGAFGLATNPDPKSVFGLAAVDDITNSVIIRASQ